jgi:hypothetical protein
MVKLFVLSQKRSKEKMEKGKNTPLKLGNRIPGEKFRELDACFEKSFGPRANPVSVGEAVEIIFPRLFLLAQDRQNFPSGVHWDSQLPSKNSNH